MKRRATVARGGLPKTVAKLAVVDQGSERRGEGLRVSRRHEDPVMLMLDPCIDAADIGGNGGKTREHSFADSDSRGSGQTDGVTAMLAAA